MASIGQPSFAWFETLEAIDSMPCNAHKFDDMLAWIKHHTASSDDDDRAQPRVLLLLDHDDPNYTADHLLNFR